jgi:hypothetical protein
VEVTSDPANDATIVDYILGDLPEEEMTRLEKRYFADDDLHDRVEAAETDLVEA